jgi:3-methyladenine DNA glycosylase AlkD
MHPIINKLQAEIDKYDVPANQLNYQRFFKEKLDDPVGLKASILRSIINKTFIEIKKLPKDDILKICDELLSLDKKYYRGFAFEWALKVGADYKISDFGRFEKWLKNHVDNWGACDSLCCGALGTLLDKYPALFSKSKKWARSKNRWLRRASAVSLIISLRHKHALDHLFEIADIVLTDTDDMVQKGYGWALKEAGNNFRDEVFEYVMKNKAAMPRTALRYAIENFPPAMRKKAMT